MAVLFLKTKQKQKVRFGREKERKTMEILNKFHIIPDD